MGTFTTGIGLISGIDIASYVEAVLALESQGKSRLQLRITDLKAQQAALLDVNARLLNFKDASKAFRVDRIFQSVLASSNNEDVLTATASASAQPGTFSFIVKQLVSTSQFISDGFVSRDESPLGLDQLAFEFGQGSLVREMSLEELNGGTGVDRGRITINDSNGGSATVDLTDVTTLDEVIDRINAAGVSVNATVEGDHLVMTDTAGGAGTMTISDYGDDTTATELGIAGTAVAGVITGTDINVVGRDTALSSLNDGNGVLIESNNPDLVIWGRDNVAYEIDLGRIDQDIDDDTLLEELNNGDGITISTDSDNADLKITDRDGTVHEINLTGLTTVGGLRTRIASETGGAITLAVHADGDKFTVTDTTGGAGLLKVEGGGTNGIDTAEDLGILNEDGVSASSFDGDVVPAIIDSDVAQTIGDVIDRINDAVDWNGDPNNGRLVASIGDDGKSIKLTSTVASPTRAISVVAPSTNAYAAGQLGMLGNGTGNEFHGERIIAGLNTVMVDSLNGGNGLNGATTISITDRTGAASLTLNTLDTYVSLSEIVDAINTEAAAQGVSINVAMNDVGNGLKVIDTSGGSSNLVISGDAATALGIEADVAEDSVAGSNLQLQYVSVSTRLSQLNYGRGIGTGSFRITDGFGESDVVNIGGTEETVLDVIEEINSRGLAVRARINDNGDGIILEEYLDDLPPGSVPFVAIKVTSEGGSTAADLNLLGESSDIEGGYIDGSYERIVDLNTSDSLDNVVEKINDAGIPVIASVINTGSGVNPFRLSLASEISGTSGRMLIDSGGVDLGLSRISRGDDAKVFFGSENPEDAFLLTSSTNSLNDVLRGVTIDLHRASDEAVQLTLTRDVETITGAVTQFVTTFNDVIGRINDYDFYNSETEERGVLLGSSTTQSVQSALYRVVTGRAFNVGGQFQYLSQVGIDINRDGELTLNVEEFKAAYAEDPDAVEELFAAYDITVGSENEIVQGVTVTSDETTYHALGFGNLVDRLLEDLTDSIDGTMSLADDSLQDQINLANNRIEFIDQRLEARREQLFRQFTAMEMALAELQTQSSALLAIQTMQTSTTS